MGEEEKNDFEIEQSEDLNDEAKAAEALMQEQMAQIHASQERMKHIKKIRLEEAREAIRANIDGKIGIREFVRKTSGVYGGFWHAIWAKLTMKKTSDSVMNKLSEIEKGLEIADKDEKDDLERSENLDKELKTREDIFGTNTEETESALDKKGDLARHEYTGRGHEFQGSRAETLAKTNDELELGGFKQKVYDQALAKIQEQKKTLQEARDKVRKRFDDLIRENVSSNTELTEADYNDLFSNHDRINELDALIERNALQDKEDQKRLEQIPKEKKKLNSRIDDLLVQIQMQNDDYQAAKKLCDLAQTAYDKYEKPYAKFVEMKQRGESILDEDLEAFQIIERRFLKAQKNLQKISKDFAIFDVPRKNAEKDIAALTEELNALEEETAELKNDALKREDEVEAYKEEREKLVNHDNELKAKMPYYSLAIGMSSELRTLDNKLEAVQLSEKNLKNDVLNSDVVEFLADNAAHDRIRGITIGGEVFLDEDHVKELGFADSKEIKLDKDDLARNKEIQKVVRALKSRDIFKYANGLNAGEYVTYDNETGKFRLFKGSALDKEGKAAYVGEFRSKYFEDSNIFTNHLINQDGNAFRRQMLGGMIVGAAKGLGTAIAEGFKNLPKTIPEKLSKIPLVGLFFEEQPEETYIKAASESSMVDDAISKLCSAIDVNNVLKEADYDLKGLYQQTMYTLAYLKAAIKEIPPKDMAKMLASYALKPQEAYVNMSTIGEYIIAVKGACEGIARGDIQTKEQTKALKHLLKAGNDRMANIMKFAITESKIERFNSIVDLTENVLQDTFVLSTGLSSGLFSMGVSAVSGITKSVHEAVMRNKTKEEFLNDPRILGGINYDKNLISDNAFDRILSSTIGINSRDDLYNTLHIMDAIDMNRAAKETMGKDANVTKTMSALGFKSVSQWNKVSVEDILKKTTGKEMDVKTELRNSTEKEGFHFTSFFKKIWQTITGTRSGEDKVTRTRREENLYKQNELLKKKFSDTELRKSEGAKKLYMAYKEGFVKAKLAGDLGRMLSDPRTNKILDPVKDRETIISFFKETPEAIAATNRIASGFSPKQMNKFLGSAIGHVKENILKEKSEQMIEMTTFVPEKEVPQERNENEIEMKEIKQDALEKKQPGVGIQM